MNHSRMRAVLIMGRDPVELAKRAKHKSPAMQVIYMDNNLAHTIGM